MARNVTDLPTVLPKLTVSQKGSAAPSLQLVILNDELATQLSLSPQWLRSDAGLKFFIGHGADHGVNSGAGTLPGAYTTPIATAYAGHQFGNFVGLLGDGRAFLLATVEARPGLIGLPCQANQSDYPEETAHSDSTQSYEIQAKGTGPTPFSRGDDGKATLTSALQEYLISETMYALGIPTTRALAVITTDEEIYRGSQTPFDGTDPTTELRLGGIVVRVTSSHLRVGTFELVIRSEADTGVMDRLIEFAAQRHGHEGSTESVLRDVVKRQANLIATWLARGFVRGVMSTDNASIAGETIDFGPCVFPSARDPRAVFSGIDHDGRYVYGAQPTIAGWNMSKPAETLLLHFTGTPEDAFTRARDILGEFADELTDALSRRWLPKLGIPPSFYDDPLAIPLVHQWQALLAEFGLDHTDVHRALIEALADGDGQDFTVLTALSDNPAFPAAAAKWGQLWKRTREELGIEQTTALPLMKAANPLYIPRNYLVTEALAAAGAGDLTGHRHLLEAVTNPCESQGALAGFIEPAPRELGTFRSYCET